MKPVRTSIVIGLLIIVVGGIWWLLKCCDKHYVDVYINSECQLVTLENDEPIPELLVFPGDHVIWNNMSGAVVELNLPAGWFAEDHVFIPVDQRVTLKVLRDPPGQASITITGTCGAGTPGVKIGEDP